MIDERDPIRDVVALLRAHGITVIPTGDAKMPWQINDTVFTDAELAQLADRLGPVETG